MKRPSSFAILCPAKHPSLLPVGFSGWSRETELLPSSSLEAGNFEMWILQNESKIKEKCKFQVLFFFFFLKNKSLPGFRHIISLPVASLYGRSMFSADATQFGQPAAGPLQRPRLWLRQLARRSPRYSLGSCPWQGAAGVQGPELASVRGSSQRQPLRARWRRADPAVRVAWAAQRIC